MYRSRSMIYKKVPGFLVSRAPSIFCLINVGLFDEDALAVVAIHTQDVDSADKV